MEDDYVYEILSQGNCPALVSGGVYYDGSVRKVFWDRSSLSDAYRLLEGRSEGPGLYSQSPSFMSLLAFGFMALDAADDWLIPMNRLFLAPGGVWYDPKSRRVRFMVSEPFTDEELGPAEAAVLLAEGFSAHAETSGFRAACVHIKRAAANGAALGDLIRVVAELGGKVLPAGTQRYLPNDAPCDLHGR